MHRLSKLHFNLLIECSGTACFVPKNSKFFMTLKDRLYLQQANSIDIGVLYSKIVAVHIIEQVFSQIKKKRLTKI